MGLRVARCNSGELIHLAGYFSLANTLPHPSASDRLEVCLSLNPICLENLELTG